MIDMDSEPRRLRKLHSDNIKWILMHNFAYPEHKSVCHQMTRNYFSLHDKMRKRKLCLLSKGFTVWSQEVAVCSGSQVRPNHANRVVNGSNKLIKWDAVSYTTVLRNVWSIWMD